MEQPEGYPLGFRYVFHPGDHCGDCRRQLDVVYLALGADGPGVCNDCAERRQMPDHYVAMALALNAVDLVLAAAPEDARVALLDTLVEYTHICGPARVPEGRSVRLPAREAIHEFAMRWPSDRSAEFPLVVSALVPEATNEDIAAAREVAIANSATAESYEMHADLALVLLERIPGAREREITPQEAIRLLGIDPERFMGAMVSACAARGVSPRSLPAAVVDECLAAAKVAA
jgi:hypothetical protein